MSARWQPGQSGNPAGRPKGAVDRRRREILAEAQERGVDPIQILFAAIEHFMERAKETTGEEQDDHILAAVSVAKETAPFFSGLSATLPAHSDRACHSTTAHRSC